MEPPLPPRPLPALPDELVEDILIRSPPDDPASLVRAALVCKRWCRLVSGAGFRRRLREFHRAAPMLGVLFGTRSRTRFVPTSTFRPSPPNGDGNFWRAWRPIDARHGRVLLHGMGRKPGEPLGSLFAVWDPITGDFRYLPTPREYLKSRAWSAAVLCAAAGGDACDHLDCHRGSFQVIIVGCDREETDACIYSSVTGAWSQPASSQLQHHGAFLHMETAIAFVCNTLYFVFGDGRNLLEYDLASQEMSVIDIPLAYSDQYYGCITTEDGRLGFARVEHSKLYLWWREAGHDVDDGWTETKVIELEKLLPADVCFSISVQVVGFADGVGVRFVDIGDRLFTIDLKSSQVKKVCNVTDICTSNIFPYMSFVTPALGAVSIDEGARAASSSA